MLVMSRRPGEVIVIGNDIAIKVIGFRGDNVRLGIAAPKEIPVHRQEVADAIKAEVAIAAMQPNEDGCPLTPEELPIVVALSDAFDHTQFEDDGGAPSDLSKLGITFRPKQPR